MKEVTLYGIPMCNHCKIAEVKLTKEFGTDISINKVMVDDDLTNEFLSKGFELFPILEYCGILYKGYREHLTDFINKLKTEDNG